jgi:hypothetical protein
MAGLTVSRCHPEERLSAKALSAKADATKDLTFATLRNFHNIWALRNT